MHYRQAISVKYLPATNTKGSRVKAYCDAGAMVMSYHQDEICPYTNCAVELCKKLGWYGVRLVGGIVKSGEYVFTIDDDDSALRVIDLR